MSKKTNPGADISSVHNVLLANNKIEALECYKDGNSQKKTLNRNWKNVHNIIKTVKRTT